MAHLNSPENSNNPEGKKSIRVYVDGTGNYYLVDRHDNGIFTARDFITGKTAYVDALALESCREATADEIEKLGIKLS